MSSAVSISPLPPKMRHDRDSRACSCANVHSMLTSLPHLTRSPTWLLQLGGRKGRRGRSESHAVLSLRSPSSGDRRSLSGHGLVRGMCKKFAASARCYAANGSTGTLSHPQCQVWESSFGLVSSLETADGGWMIDRFRSWVSASLIRRVRVECI